MNPKVATMRVDATGAFGLRFSATGSGRSAGGSLEGLRVGRTVGRPDKQFIFARIPSIVDSFAAGRRSGKLTPVGASRRAGLLAVAAVAVAVMGRGCGALGGMEPGTCACASDEAGALLPSTGARDAGDDGAPAPFPALIAAQWISSESCPFSTDHATADWFRCPHPIAHRLDRGPDLPLTMPGGTARTRIAVDPRVTYQSILGIGISMEESSVFNLSKLSPAKRTEVLTRMLDPDRGTGINLIRVTMGTSDFTGRPWYSYDDVPKGQTDPHLDHFSIQKDIEYGIVSVIKEMIAVNPKILFFAAPWSPPAWMKSNQAIAGGLPDGVLLTADIPVLAKYFRRFIEAYRALGIPIYAITMQNEPTATSDGMPTCLVTAEQEAQLVKATKQEFSSGGIDTKVWIYDQNFDIGVQYAKTVFGDTAALAATDGVAFHDYAGDPSAMSTLHDLYPDKDIFFTEKTLWGVAGVDRAMQYFRNWARSYVSWVTMLDQDGLPNDGPNSEKPRRFVRSLTYTGDEYYPTPEYYLFGLYSKLVQPGAKRIKSDYGSADTVTDVAFANPDGTIVVVVANQTNALQEIALESEGNQAWAAIDPKTADALVWRQGAGTSTAPPTAPPSM
jgi:glucosylceramidase